MWGKTCQTIVALLSTGCCCYGDLDLGKFHPLHEIYRHMEDLRGCPREKNNLENCCLYGRTIYSLQKTATASFLASKSWGGRTSKEKSGAAYFIACVVLKRGNKTFSRRALVFCFGSGSGECRKKQSILIDGGIHAREWAAVSTAVFIMGALAKEQE